jgi:hypothetical protein
MMMPPVQAREAILESFRNGARALPFQSAKFWLAAVRENADRYVLYCLDPGYFEARGVDDWVHMTLPWQHFSVQDRITRGQPESRRPQDLGVKKGPFYVLFLSNMPAILVETGFLTNRSEAERLRDPAYVDSLAERIAEGVDRYRDDQATRLALQP